VAGAAISTPVHQAPREHELGRPGEERLYRLELKLLADVGLVGYPNAGKSTLISRISAAKPKIADYPFTTLEPNLGVVTVGEEPDLESFVVADMPGLIEGAHLGQGLGVQFLRHIERTRLLVHLVDVSDASGRPDPVEDFKIINKELASFTSSGINRDFDSFSDDSSAQSSPRYPLAHKPMVVVATKIDSANPEKLKKLAAHVKRRKLEFHAISAVTGQGIDELKWSLARHLRPAADQG
jgi:GTP-binding protein